MTNKPHDPTFKIDSYVSSENGVRLLPYGDVTLNDRLKESEEPFSVAEYARQGHMPFALPQIDLSPLEAVYPRCLDMPIHLKGDSKYVLPEEWVGLKPLIENIISQEHATNPHWADYYTYITVDCKPVVVSEQQRHGGLHVDGFQGARIQPKTKINRNYVMTTNGGTRFYPQPFAVVDETKFNVFQGFDLQAKDFVIAEENVAYFMDAYCVHESGIAEREGLRTFLRVTYDVKEFDRAGNTHNSMLKYDWDMVARNVHESVATPAQEDVDKALEFYGITK